MARKPPGELSSYWGSLDGVFGENLCGWARNRANPDERVELDLVVNGKAWHRVRAANLREDLKAAGEGDGLHAFQLPLSSLALPGGEPIRYVNAYTVVDRRELPGSPWVAPDPMAEAAATLPFYKVDPLNVAFAIRQLAGKSVDYLVLDTNNLCNADCVYCAHSRGPEVMEIAQFEELLDRSVRKLNVLQFGCGQEPTADSRLGTFLTLARGARCRPERIQLITNGTLLDRHDPLIFAESQLDSLMLSIDTLDPVVNARLRAGTDLSRMLKNLDAFRANCPWAQIQFSVVVSSATVDGIPDLVEYGRTIGVTGYFFREVTSYLTLEDRPRRADFEDWMAELRLPPGRFERFAAELARLEIEGKYTLLPAARLQQSQSQLKYQARRAPFSHDPGSLHHDRQ